MDGIITPITVSNNVAVRAGSRIRLRQKRNHLKVSIKLPLFDRALFSDANESVKRDTG
jgi:hypothetical protein